MKTLRRILLLAGTALLFGCSDGNKSGKMTIGVAFETLQTEFWVAGFEAIKAECAKRGIEVTEAVADNDANRQLEQVQNFITRKVDGIIMVPKDADTCLPAIRAANEAGICVVAYRTDEELHK